MDLSKWQRWVMQTAARWDDLVDIVEATEIESIDKEHHDIIEQILNMGEGITTDGAQTYNSEQLSKQLDIVKELKNTLHQHRITEEYFIDRYKLPGGKEKLIEHDAMIRKIDGISEKFDEGIVSTFQVMKKVLIKEMILHINGYDKKTFKLEHFTPALLEAEKWEDVSEIIRTTGIPIIDYEHKQLTLQMIAIRVYLSQVDSKIKTDAHKDDFLALVQEFFISAGSHFDHEISFINTYQLPADRQKASHNEFIVILSKKIDDMKRGVFKDLFEFTSFLFDWWVHHINGMDYVEFHYSKVIESAVIKGLNADDLHLMIKMSGIEKIDNDYTDLFKLILELNFLSEKETESNQAIDQFRRMYSNVETFFRNEAQLICNKNMEMLEFHHKSQMILLQNIEEALDYVISGRSHISPSLIKRIILWLVEYINGVDNTLYFSVEKS